VSPTSQIDVNERARTRGLRIGLSCSRWTELRWQPRDAKLEQTLLAGKPFESVLAEVDQLQSRHLGVFDDACGRGRNENLAATSGVADASGAVHSDPDVTVFSEMGLGSMKTDSHTDFRVLRPDERGERELRADRSGDGSSGAIESDEEAITSCVNFPSAVCRKRVAQ
jgi:hypothetical protein